jgi:hypothetical protein
MARRRQQNRRGVQAAQARPASHAAKAGADLFESTAGAVGARLVGSRSMVALMGVAGPPRSLSKGKSIMKRALTGIASVGILVVTVGVETANAQSYRRYGAARTYTPQPYPPQSRGSIPRGVPRTVPFSDPNSPEATGGGNIGYNRGLPDGGY